LIPLKFKQGVKFKGIKPEILVALPAVMTRFEDVAADYVMITSGLDGTHSAKSLHYEGLAIDLRTRHITLEKAQAVVKALKMDLGDQYDVVLERTHIHLEFDPK